MKKQILVILIGSILALSCVGCGTTYQEATGQTKSKSDDDFGDGYFTVVSEWGNPTSIYYIVYANDTKVKYFVMWTGNQCGITPLYNADGTLQIYEE